MAACASYPQRTAEAAQAFQSGRVDRAIELYGDPDTTDCAFLGGAELGTVLLANGEWERAAKALHQAADAARSFEDRSLVSPDALGEGLTSWVLNESMQAYEGEGYERVMLHAMLAMTYLARGLLQDVGVEVKRANALLENEEKLYNKSYAAGGLGHYLSALAYELDGELDQAYIDYKRLHDKQLASDLARRALARIASRLQYRDDLDRWTKDLPVESLPGPQAASVVVIAGIGMGPFKQDHTLTIPTTSGLLQWSVPSYVARPQTVTSLLLRATDSQSSVRTDVLENVAKVAKENLDDRLGWLAAKSAVRGIMKRQLTKQLADDHGLAGQVIGDLFTFISERADLRSWQTLPDSWQACRMFLEPGEHEFVLESGAGEDAYLGRFQLDAGETMIVIARSLGPRLFAHPLGGRRLDAAPTVLREVPTPTGIAPTSP